MLSDERIEQLELEVKVLRANNKGLKDKIDEQSKEIEEMKKQIDLDNECEVALNNRIMDLENADKKWEDKIKAKIEEIENTGIDVAWEQVNYTIREQDRAKIEVLQSLLEKE